MSDPTTYTGGCHCGKIRYRITSNLTPLVACNCSICAKRGWILTFVPADQFELLSGEGASTDYQFGKKHVHHMFCSTCGVSAYGTGKGPTGMQVMSINVRCLDDVDVSKLTVTTYDGKNR